MSDQPSSRGGSARATVIVMCCPACQATAVFRSHWQAERQLAYWECRLCHHRWKELREVGGGGSKAVIP